MVADLVFFVLGAWVGVGGAVVMISLMMAGSKATTWSRLDGISVDRSSDAI